jgi:hypothetical protein
LERARMVLLDSFAIGAMVMCKSCAMWRERWRVCVVGWRKTRLHEDEGSRSLFVSRWRPNQ